MDIIKTYGSLVKKHLDSPNVALKLLKTGFNFEQFALSRFPSKDLPPSLQYLNLTCLKYILEPLNFPERSAFVNLFAPTEFLHAMNIYPQFAEAFASFLSGTQCEDGFIEAAEKAGLSETLCSYHKAFLGAIESQVLPQPKFAITSSVACDGNINTFRHAAHKYNIPCYSLDIPYLYNEESEHYVVNQLKEMVLMMEDAMHESLDESKLKEVIVRENKSKEYMNKYLDSLSTNYFPNTLTLEMYKLFTSHAALGRIETLNFYKMLSEDILKFPKSEGKRFLWIHLLPFYSAPLKEYFNLNPKNQLLICDLSFDYMEQLNVEKPYESIAKKMILNNFNGSFDRKAEKTLEMCKRLNADAVISFSHWGCKQSSGGTMLLKEILNENNIPVLNLDGDAVDRRNAHDGQMRTRFEAFLEILNN